MEQSTNPLFDIWKTEDNLILSYLISFLIVEVLTQVANYSTSHKVWQALTTTFAS
jgi:hypothetical protein